LKYFRSVFENDDRFIIQRENGKSSSFCFTIILNPKKNIRRVQVIDLMKDAKIGFSMITGGCFPRHEVIRYFDYELHGEMANGNIAHDQGFFIGNHPSDLTKEIDRFHAIMDQF
jgi:CDP-6-deoxy-D-xylo-4-hexulose-3-dehydrase